MILQRNGFTRMDDVKEMIWVSYVIAAFAHANLCVLQPEKKGGEARSFYQWILARSAWRLTAVAP